MKKVATAILIAGIIGLVIASPQLFPGVQVVAQAEPVINKVMDIATIGAVPFIVFLTVMAMLGKKI